MWQEIPSAGGWQRLWVDSGVRQFVVNGDNSLWVLRTNGDLVKESVGWQQSGLCTGVDHNVASFSIDASGHLQIQHKTNVWNIVAAVGEVVAAAVATYITAGAERGAAASSPGVRHGDGGRAGHGGHAGGRRDGAAGATMLVQAGRTSCWARRSTGRTSCAA